MDKTANYKKLKDICLDRGAALFGVSLLDPDKERIFLPGNILKGLNRAVSLAVRLSDPILDQITDRPTKLYFHHYRAVNMFMDQLAIHIQQYIQKAGFKALPIPASNIVDWEKQLGHLSHKRFAELSGIGWTGRNNLIVNPKYGSRIRLVTILTDMPLSIDKPLDDNCGDCTRCMDVCPSASIKKSSEEFDHKGCYEMLKEFRNKGYVDQFICGICVKACNGG
ncbi:MAG: epoxyqueuosine reductase [Candidatus Omnitrophica bacterium]|nr:epoxyqueuosine reductase [Candidatus Omnitrophota bacterium]